MKLRYSKGRIIARTFNAMVLLLAVGVCALPAQAQPTGSGEDKEISSGAFKGFFENAKAGFMFRSVYFNRTSNGDHNAAGRFDQEALGAGGWLYGNTGEIGGMLSLGAAYNFTLPVYAPEEKNFNYILRDPGQDTVSALGEAYARLRWGNHDLIIGRQSINNTWYMDDVVRFFYELDQGMTGRRDIRSMQPIQYEAATIKGRLREDTLRYYGGYIRKARQSNDNDFRNLYKATYQTRVWPEDQKTGDTSGAGYAGIQLKPMKNLMIQGSYTVMQDMLNMAYVDLDYVWRLAGSRYVRIATQGMYQTGNGDNLITTGRDFNTRLGALYLEARLAPWLAPYGTAGVNSTHDEIRSPISVGPCYLWQRVNENAKAGERTWILGALFDFAPAGAKGLQFDINYGQRRNRHQWNANTTDGVTTHTYAKISNWDELATDLIYTFPPETCLKGLRVRLRYARVWEEGGTLDGAKTTDEYRTDMGWNIPIK